MRKKELIDRVTALAQPICGEAGVVLWDVTFEKEGKGHLLTLFIDRPEGGIFIEDCERVSRAIDPLLDDPIFDSLPPYTLSVSSSGVQRRLLKAEHYQWAMGKAVECTFYKAGELGATAVGILEGVTADTLTLSIAGTVHTIERAKLSGVRMHFEF